MIRENSLVQIQSFTLTFNDEIEPSNSNSMDDLQNPGPQV